MRREITLDVDACFARQHGLIADDQLRAAGVTAQMVWQRFRAGDWRRVCRGVIALEGVPPAWEQGPMAVTLAPGRAAVSYGSALRLAGMDGFEDFDEVHAIIRRGGHVELASTVVVHESRRFQVDQVVLSGDIRMTNVATSLTLSAGWHDATSVGKALDHALRVGRSPRWIAQVADHWQGRGVPGSGVLLEMLGERVGRPLPRSWYERLTKEAFDRAGEVFEHEHQVRDGRRKLCTIDLAQPGLLVGVECQSTRWHADPTARQADLRRKRRLRVLGWEIVEVWWSDLDRFDEVLTDLLIAIERQRQLLAPRRSVSAHGGSDLGV